MGVRVPCRSVRRNKGSSFQDNNGEIFDEIVDILRL